MAAKLETTIIAPSSRVMATGWRWRTTNSASPMWPTSRSSVRACSWRSTSAGSVRLGSGQNMSAT